MVKDIFIEFEKFLHSPARNKWIYSDELKIYVRKSKRFLEPHQTAYVVDCIDLASIEVMKEEDYGKGIFTKFLHEFIQKYPEYNIFVESVLTKRFELFFEKHGFKRTSDSSTQQCNMYRLKQK